MTRLSTLRITSRSRRARVASVVAIAAIVGGAILTGATAASAAPGDTLLKVLTAQKTGTPDWDGLDTNETNAIVRTNDTVSYTVSVRNEPIAAGSGTATDVVISFTVPKGQEIVNLPSLCIGNSSIVPATLGALAPPLDETSWESFPQQVVTCEVADRTAGSFTQEYDFVAKARSEVPNGTVFDPFTATVTADESLAPVTSAPLPAVTVVSEAIYDLSKNGTSLSDDSSGLVVSDTVACTNPAYATAGYTGCETLQFPILISVQANGKGSTPLSSPITFNDDLTPASFYGAAAISGPYWNAALAPSVVGCGIATLGTNMASYYPYGKIAGNAAATTGNSVRDSGTISCTPGDQGLAEVTITDTDTTATTYPTTNGTLNVQMPLTQAYIVSGWITVEFPVAAIDLIGTSRPGAPGENQLAYENEYTDLEADDIAGVELIDEPNTENNHRHATIKVEIDGTFGKAFAGDPGNPTNSGGSGYSAGTFAGPVGSGDGRDGNGIVQAGSRINSFLTRTVVSPPGYGATTTILCDSWDNSLAALTADQWPAITAGNSSPAVPYGTVGYLQNLPSNGAPVWLSSSTNPRPAFTVEYRAATGGRTAANDCADEDNDWFSNPASVPGNDATLASQGIYTAVGQARIIFTMASDLAVKDSMTVAFSIGLTVRQNAVAGDVIGNWAAGKLVFSDTAVPVSNADAVAAVGSVINQSTYNPNNHTGVLGDRVNVQAAVARIVKEVFNSALGDYSSTTVPEYNSGATVKYRLSSSLTAGVATGATAETYIEDCLPRYQTFAGSSIEGGTVISPAVEQQGAPSGTSFPCASNRTYLRWNLGQLTVNQPIPKIVYEVTIDALAPNGNLINNVQITADGDISSVGARSDTAAIQIDTSPGIKIVKTALTPTVEVNPNGATNPRTVAWKVQFAVIDTNGVSNPDVIDILPADGIDASDFAGDLDLATAVATASTGTPVTLYTSRSTASINGDSKHASNLATGSTVWCDAPSGGNIVRGAGSACPTGLDTVTGVRVYLVGAVTAGTSIDLTVTMTPVNNADGDVYDNSAEANADGVLQGVGPVSDEIAVVASSVGDYVWIDKNKNGLQDTAEKPIKGVPVTLNGVDIDGNVVTATTTTDATGKYLFDSIPSGEYTITFDIAWLKAHHYALTTLNAGTDAELDSDAIIATGSTAPFTLGFDADRVDLDAGVVPVTTEEDPDGETPGDDTPSDGDDDDNQLAHTGLQIATPIVTASLLAVLGGILLVLVRRRRQA